MKSSSNRSLAFLLIALLGLSSCADLEKKFVRKRKPRETQPLFNLELAPQPYAVHYREHFLYWRAWHGEILRDLGGNPKRLERDLREARRHLVALEKYLEPEKGKVVDSYVREFDEIAARIQTRGLALSASTQGVIGHEFESLGLRISNSLAFKDVKTLLRPDPLPFDLNEYQSEEPEVLSASVKLDSPPAENLNK